MAGNLLVPPRMTPRGCRAARRCGVPARGRGAPSVEQARWCGQGAGRWGTWQGTGCGVRALAGHALGCRPLGVVGAGMGADLRVRLPVVGPCYPRGIPCPRERKTAT